jgi:hypothetical protein
MVLVGRGKGRRETPHFQVSSSQFDSFDSLFDSFETFETSQDGQNVATARFGSLKVNHPR